MPVFFARAVMLCVPLLKAEVVIDHAPVALAVPVPTTTPSERISTARFAPAVPVKVGVVSLVLLSVLEVPPSDEAARSGTLGVGTGALIVTDNVPELALTLPARSLA